MIKGTLAPHRRRKKRSNYGMRSVEVRRSCSGFGFTLSGEHPCRLSLIVPNTPAEKAGLRMGDCLISVNGLNVSKLPHDKVVQLVGNSFDSIKLQIAENYGLDSSDEENAAMQQLQASDPLENPAINQSYASYHKTDNLAPDKHVFNHTCNAHFKSRLYHHKTKMYRLRTAPHKKRSDKSMLTASHQRYPSVLEKSNDSTVIVSDMLRPLIEEQATRTPINTNITNVSAMVRATSTALEYRTIVGYLGTIDQPMQISHNSKLQTVRSCIRRLRQEKRHPTTVLMTILPDNLQLQDASGQILATYASDRLNFVSSSSESENRFFGLVTNAVYRSQGDDIYDDHKEIDEDMHGEQLTLKSTLLANEARLLQQSTTGQVNISHSCHVFVVDTKLCDHNAHIERANLFRIPCTRDPISQLCLEFPNNSEYVVNLIRSMYTMPPICKDHRSHGEALGVQVAHSPQPSNHSEISTTTSNSDSGIGFNNDFANISERILVVDFPAWPQPRLRTINNTRPQRIFQNIERTLTENRLTVRAMPDPVPRLSPSTWNFDQRPDLLANFDLIKSPTSSLIATRSCDDVMGRDTMQKEVHQRVSMDDLSSHIGTHENVIASEYPNAPNQINSFFHPTNIVYNHNQHTLVSTSENGTKATYNLQAKDYRVDRPDAIISRVPHKLSPQVFAGHADNSWRTSDSKGIEALGFPDIDIEYRRLRQSRLMSDGCSSLQDLYFTASNNHLNVSPLVHSQRTLDIRNHSLNLEHPSNVEQEVPASRSPFRRAWGQSSYRTLRSDKHSHLLQPVGLDSSVAQGILSLSVSDNDMYAKFKDNTSHEQKQLQRQCQFAVPSSSKAIHNTGPIPVATNVEVSKLPHPQLISDESSRVQSLQSTVQEGIMPSKITIDATGAGDEQKCGVAAWGASFERLLADAAGLHTFAEFLKKEFSAENIYFWTACERYRHILAATERVVLANTIYKKHLANGALEPVNVDSSARSLSAERLQEATCDLFSAAQKQIFNLMKFDSYQRFIRSDMYRACTDAERRQQPLPYSADSLDELLRIQQHESGHGEMDGAGGNAKLKKSVSNAEDRRRKSLLSWPRKTRSKSRDNTAEESNRNNANSDGRGELTDELWEKIQKPSQLLANRSLRLACGISEVGFGTYSNSELHSSRSSLSSFDAFPTALSGRGVGDSLCRVKLNDGATTVVQTSEDETVAQLVERLLEKRGLDYVFYNVVDAETTKPIDLLKLSCVLAGRRVLIERGVAFKLDLPDPKVISVKSKPKKQLLDVVRPILHKYHYTMDSVKVLRRDTQMPIDLAQPVTAADGLRLQVVLTKPKISLTPMLAASVTPSAVCQTFPIHSDAPMHRNGIENAAIDSRSTLEEITNMVFKEVLQGKVATHAPSSVRSLKSDDDVSEKSLFSRMNSRRDSRNYCGTELDEIVGKISKKKSTSCLHSVDDANCVTLISHPLMRSPFLAPDTVDIQKPLIAKLTPGVQVQITERIVENQDELLEGLKRAQLARLEDQRGTEINFELPDFLKNKESSNSVASDLRKARANLSPVHNSAGDEIRATTPFPLPAPRLSISNRHKCAASPTFFGTIITEEQPVSNPSINHSKSHCCSERIECATPFSVPIIEPTDHKGPPPLPPKPKVLPIKPSNWGVVTILPKQNHATIASVETPVTPAKSPYAYLEENNSSVV